MYREDAPSWLKRLDFLLIDMLALEISFLIAYVLRHGITNISKFSSDYYTNVFIALIFISAIESVFVQSYQHILKRGQYDEFRSVFKRACYIVAMLIIYLYLTKRAEEFSRIIYIITWEMTVILTYVFRQVWKLILNKMVESKKLPSISFVVLTTSDKVENVLTSIKGDLSMNYKVSGLILVDRNMTGKKLKGIEVVADRENAVDYLCRNWVDEIFIGVPEEYAELETKIVDNCVIMGIVVHKYLAKELRTKGGVRFVQKIGNYTVLTYGVKVITARQLIIKRMMDIAGAIVGLCCTAVIFVFVAPLIFIKSPGPIFFKQWRIGRNGKKFQIYKFRSMYMDAEERKAELMAQNKIKDGMMFKIENDPRIIGGENGKGIGNFIRNTSLDEFPQFLNVLKGDMSLVGTRPPTLDEWKKYQLHHRRRMAIKPGLTGMWQVSGRSDITDFEEVVRLDTEYINNWCLSNDIKIILKTVMVVLFRKGAS